VPAPGPPLFCAALVPAPDSAPNAQLPSFAWQPQNPSKRLIPNETHREIFHKSATNSSRIFDSAGGDIQDVVPLVLDSLAYKIGAPNRPHDNFSPPPQQSQPSCHRPAAPKPFTPSHCCEEDTLPSPPLWELFLEPEHH
jgi:hypothetical protein